MQWFYMQVRERSFYRSLHLLYGFSFHLHEPALLALFRSTLSDFIYDAILPGLGIGCHVVKG